jgi:hypothetical protein
LFTYEYLVPNRRGGLDKVVSRFSENLIHPGVDAFTRFSGGEEKLAMTLRRRSEGEFS